MKISILREVKIKDRHGNSVFPINRQPPPKSQIRALLCVLILQRSPSPGTYLKTLIWDDLEKDRTSSWTSLVSRARTMLPPDLLISERGPDKVMRYHLDFKPSDTIDVDLFYETMASAKKYRKSGDLRGAADLYGQGLDLWQGAADTPLLSDFPATYTMKHHHLGYDELQHQYSIAAENYAETRLFLGEHSIELTHTIHEFITHQPTNERLHQLRMLTLYRLGRKGEALKAYRDAHVILHHEVEAPPGPALDQLRNRIAHDDPHLHEQVPGLIPLPHGPMCGNQNCCLHQR